MVDDYGQGPFRQPEDEEWVDDSDTEFSVDSYGLLRSVISDHGILSLDSTLI